MNHQQRTQIFSKVNDIARMLPEADVCAFFNNLTEAFQEAQQVQRDIAKIEATPSIIVTEIKRRYALYEKIFNRIFDERRDAMRCYFEIIDRGVAGDDRELILKGLQGLSTVVSSSPFANLKDLSGLLESGRIEI